MRSIVTALAAVLSLAPSYPAAATDCPGAAIKDTFVVERGGDSKTEVFRGDDGSVRQVMRYRGRALLETTMHEGLFELERLDRGTRYVLRPKADLRKLLPLKAKQKIEVGFDVKKEG